MFMCYTCKAIFNCVSTLCLHIKSFHPGDVHGKTYKCAVNGCFQNFNSIYSFKRHLLNKHKNIDTDYYESETLNNNYSINTTPLTLVPFSDISASNINNEENQLVEIESDSNLSENDLNLLAMKKLCRLYGKPSLARCQVTEFSHLLEEILKEIFEDFKRSINHDFSTQSLFIFEKSFHKYITSFQRINTEYRFTKALKDLGFYEDPVSFCLNNETTIILRKGIPSLDENMSSGILMPIEFQIKKFLEMPKVLDKIINNMKRISSLGKLTHFINGEKWKKIETKYSGKIVVPIFLYNDDFQIDDVLGSHSGKNAISAYYYSFPSLPDYCVSSLRNIFVAMLIKSKYIKTFGKDLVLHPLVEVFKKLEIDGIDIETNLGKKQVFIVLALVIGDNLGLNSILGFSESFNSNFFCRFCKLHKKKTHACTREIPSALRNEVNYEEDISLCNPQLTGIYNGCLLNKLQHFHVTNNYSVDIMHDVFLGTCKYGLCKVLHFYIISARLFTLELLNYRKQNFDYQQREVRNVSVPITLDNLKKNNLQMSAREVWCFVWLLPLIIGDLIPEGDDVWKYVLSLLKLVDTVLSPEMSSSMLFYLSDVIEEHNQLFQTLFKETLKPKHHLMLHYSTIARQTGPLKYLWSFRFESKHQELKSYTKAITSRVNIAYSLAVKFQFHFSLQLLDKDDIFLKTKEIKYLAHNIKDSKFYKEVKDNLAHYNVTIEDCNTVKSLQYKGTYYSQNYYLLYKDNLEHIYQIEELYLAKDQFFVICSTTEVTGFNEHLQSYLVGKKLTERVEFFPITMFISPPFNIHTLVNGKKYFRIQYL